MKFSRISNLDSLSIKNNSKKACIVLHGSGASMNDLAPLYSYLDPEKKIDWFFVDAPMTVDIGMGQVGKAWFSIDMMKLQQAMMTGSFDQVFQEERPKGMTDASEVIENFINEIKDSYPEGLFLGGFSQGSMVSFDVFLRNNVAIKKLFLLSSTLFDLEQTQDLLKKRAQSLHGISLFQSHGLLDQVLPVSGAKKLNELFVQNKIDVDYHLFQGGHEIPLNIIQKLKSFFDRIN